MSWHPPGEDMLNILLKGVGSQRMTRTSDRWIDSENEIDNDQLNFFIGIEMENRVRVRESDEDDFSESVRH